MSFVARLRPELVRVDPPWRTFGETVRGLVGVLAGALPPGWEATAVQAVLAREEEASTALLDIGAGVPHARTDGLREVAVALAVSRAGLYEAVPTVRMRIVALVLSPTRATTDHLNLLASISTMLRSASLRGELLAARTGAEAFAALERHARAQP